MRLYTVRVRVIDEDVSGGSFLIGLGIEGRSFENAGSMGLKLLQEANPGSYFEVIDVALREGLGQ